MGWTKSTLPGKYEGTSLLGDIGVDEDNIKMDLRKKGHVYVNWTRR
jgi:hypothetical protein